MDICKGAFTNIHTCEVDICKAKLDIHALTKFSIANIHTCQVRIFVKARLQIFALNKCEKSGSTCVNKS